MIIINNTVKMILYYNNIIITAIRNRGRVRYLPSYHITGITKNSNKMKFKLKYNLIIYKIGINIIQL